MLKFEDVKYVVSGEKGEAVLPKTMIKAGSGREGMTPSSAYREKRAIAGRERVEPSFSKRFPDRLRKQPLSWHLSRRRPPQRKGKRTPGAGGRRKRKAPSRRDQNGHRLTCRLPIEKGLGRDRPGRGKQTNEKRRVLCQKALG